MYRLPILDENELLPDFAAVPESVWEQTKLLVLNYPNSPTGKTVTADFYAKIIALAKERKFVVAQDAAHTMLAYGSKPLSFLSVPGAMDVGVEIHSLSKGFDMIGWRIGWVCGAERIVRALADVKDNSDSGQFGAIQNAAAFALDDDSIPVRIRTKYARRPKKPGAAPRRAVVACRVPGRPDLLA